MPIQIKWNLVSTVIVLKMLAICCMAQSYTISTDPSAKLRFAESLLDDYLALGSLSLVENDYSWHDQFESQQKSESYLRSRSILDIHSEDGIIAVENHVRQYPNDQESNLLRVALADHYFNRKDYKKSIEQFAQIDLSSLDLAERNEVLFKSGYANFITKNFKSAETIFSKVATDNSNYNSAQYYLAMCYYFRGAFDESIAAFEQASDAKQYEVLTPGYISQIYFAQKRYEELISFAQSKINLPNLKKKKEIHQLLGQAYYINASYSEALPHLEYYEQHSDELTIKQFYMLGYTQYANERYDDAILNFEQVANQDDQIAQNASYYLADCYIRTGNDQAALAAFKRTYELGFDNDINEEAYFIMAKLTMKAGQDRAAIELFNNIAESSKYYPQAQAQLGQLLLETRDYDQSIETIQALKPWSENLRKIYAQIKMMRAIKSFEKGEYKQAKTDLSDIKGMSSYAKDVSYWLGIIAHQQGQYENSQYHLDEYLKSNEASAYGNISEAQYTNIYNLLKLEQYDDAMPRMKDYLAQSHQTNAKKNDILLRAGDLAFKNSKRSEAYQYYEQASANGKQVYPVYQMALLKGLDGQYFDKIILLDKAIKINPSSSYADDVLWQLGTSYMALEKNQEAIQAYKALLTKFANKSPYQNRALLRLGLLHYNAADYLTALDYYKATFDNNPNLQEQEEAQQAIEEIYIEELTDSDGYFDFLDTQPQLKIDNLDQDSLLYRTAEVQYQTRKFAAAASSFYRYSEANASNPNALRANYYMGESYLQLEQYDLAYMAYQSVINKGPSEFYLDAIEKAAVISFNHQENYIDAFNYYTLMEEEHIDPKKKYESQVGGFRAAQKLDNTEAKLIFSDKLINSQLASNEEKQVALFQKSRILYERNEIDQVLPIFEELSKSKMSEIAAESGYRLTEIYFRKGAMDKAENQANKAYRASAEYPYWVARNILILADIAISKNDLFGAQAAVDAVLDSYEDNDDILAEAKLKAALIQDMRAEQDRVKPSANTDQLEMDESNE